MRLSVAAMLPSGALWAINTVFYAQKHVETVIQDKGESGKNPKSVARGSSSSVERRLIRPF